MPRLPAVALAVAIIAAACAADEPVETTRGSSTTTAASVAAGPVDFDGPLPEGPSALRGSPSDPALPAPIVDIALIRSGGPPPDGIPSIDDPVYAPIAEIDFVADNEPVLLVELGGEARIFPVQIMTWHELVNTTIGGVPVTVSFCPLCNSAITYDRRLGTNVLDFGTSGSLYNSAMVMYDRQTESLWSHYSAVAIAGLLTGVELERYPTQTVSWADAVAAAPDALVLTRDTGHDRSYGRNPYGGYDDVNSQPFLFDGEVDGRLAAKTRVIGIEVGDDALAVQLDSLDTHGTLDVTVGGTALTVWRKPGTASSLDASQIADGRDIGATGVFRTELDGRRLTFTPADDGRFTDTETGSIWDITGEAIEGGLAGARLTAVPHVDTFWFAWAAFLPGTEVV